MANLRTETWAQVSQRAHYGFGTGDDGRTYCLDCGLAWPCPSWLQAHPEVSSLNKDALNASKAAEIPPGGPSQSQQGSEMLPSYRYEAQVLGSPNADEPHDGDTFHALVRLGFRVLVDVHIRVFGINCPELQVNGQPNPAGQSAKGVTWGWLIEAGEADEDWPLVIDSRSFVPDDKYGTRADAIVYRKLDGASLGQALLDSGNAVPSER